MMRPTGLTSRVLAATASQQAEKAFLLKAASRPKFTTKAGTIPIANGVANLG